MTNIVIFGINSSIRKRVECSLSENTNIVAYSDSGNQFSTYKKFGYKPFWDVNSLIEKKDFFDYIIVCENEYIKWVRKETQLKRAGIPPEKILPTIVYGVKSEEPIFASTLDRFVELRKPFDGLCFGMCYSLWGFWEHCMENDWFKFSMNGSDLNIHCSWLRYLFSEYMQLMNGVKDIILEIPYYAFDWDMQCSGQVYFRMLQYFRVNEFNRFLAMKPDAKEYIERFKILTQFAQDPPNANCNNYFYSNENIDAQICSDKRNQIDMIWNREFEDSVEFNKSNLMQIYEMCEKYGKRLRICVFPLSNAFRNIHKEEYLYKRRKFYKIIDELELRNIVIDFNDINDFENSDYKDMTHLNNCGAEKLTQMIKRYFE